MVELVRNGRVIARHFPEDHVRAPLRAAGPRQVPDPVRLGPVGARWPWTASARGT